MKAYSIPASALRAALLCAAKKDTRQYLNGVWLDIPQGRIVGSDGARMFVGQIPRGELPAVLVPRDLAERALKTCPKPNRYDEAPEFFVEVAPGAVSLKHADGSFTADRDQDLQYEQYERVIPAETSGESAQYNLEFLVTAQDALRLYANDKRAVAAIEYNGDGPAVLSAAGHNAFALVMPLRTGGPAGRDWLRGEVPDVDPAS